MRFLFLEERGIIKEGKDIVLSRGIKEVNIPDELLVQFRTAYELWLKEKGNQKECDKNGTE